MLISSVPATGSGPLAYQWYRDGEVLSGATAATLSLPTVQANHAGRYHVVVSNSVGSETSQEATLQVTPFVAPPINDHFAGRIAVVGLSNVVTSLSFAATKELNEPTHAGNLGGKSVWWSWTAPNSGQFIVSSAGSDFDTLLAVYTGSALAALSPVLGNDDPQSQTRSAALKLNAVAGTTYHIAIDGFNGDAGNVRLLIKPTLVVAFAQASKLPGGPFQVNFLGEPGVRYLIQFSPDLEYWDTLATVIGHDGMIGYTDT